MYFDAVLPLDDLKGVPQVAAAAEAIGFDGLWTTETQHEPFMPLAMSTASTTRVQLGTAVAIAFPRSPTVMAHTAWDLARLSGGRFILGLGTQVKAHIERRFSSTWSSPAPRLRDYIGAMRAVWSCWQTGERLRYEGEFYTLKLMTPFFNPGPIDHPDVPVFIAGVNRQLCLLAGEVCQGFHVHPLNSASYLREALLPWIGEGLVSAGRRREDIQLTAPVFVVTGASEDERARQREEVRRQVSFYASTPTYRTILEVHGWEAQGEELGALASRGRWDDMAAVVSDEMLSEFALEGETLPDVARAALDRYTGLVDRLMFYVPFVPGERDDEWRQAAAVMHRTS